MGQGGWGALPLRKFGSAPSQYLFLPGVCLLICHSLACSFRVCWRLYLTQQRIPMTRTWKESVKLSKSGCESSLRSFLAPRRFRVGSFRTRSPSTLIRFTTCCAARMFHSLSLHLPLPYTKNYLLTLPRPAVHNLSLIHI